MDGDYAKTIAPLLRFVDVGEIFIHVLFQQAPRTFRLRLRQAENPNHLVGVFHLNQLLMAPGGLGRGTRNQLHGCLAGARAALEREASPYRNRRESALHT